MTSEELRSQVFVCTHCKKTGLPFVQNPSGKFYRFPPTIGAVGRAPLLFVGINPRVSNSNRHLHDAIVQDPFRFNQLARNRVRGSIYIGHNGLETHYTMHVRVVHALYPTACFEDVAAVTELYYCASTSSDGLLVHGSRCAARYFHLVLELVSPVVVFAVGKNVTKTLRNQFGSGRDMLTWSTGQAKIIDLPHPNSRGLKNVGIDRAIKTAQEHLHANGSQRMSDAPPSEQPTTPEAVDVSRTSAESTLFSEYRAIRGESHMETSKQPIMGGEGTSGNIHTFEDAQSGAGTLRLGSQRDIMQRLFVECDRDVERAVAAYADAERTGKAVRSSNKSKLSPERYARALLSDGLRKGWLKR